MCQLTKTYVVVLYICLVVLWLGAAHLTRQLINEFEHVISTTFWPLSASVVEWSSTLEEQQRLALACIVIIVFMVLTIVMVMKQQPGVVRAGGSLNLCIDPLDELQFPVWEKDLKYVLGKERLMAAIESKLTDSDERNLTAYRLIVKTVPKHLAGNVLTTDNAFEAFKNLKDKYGTPSWEKLQMLKDRILRLKVTSFEDESVDKLVRTIVNYETQLRLAGQKVDSSEMIFLLSNSLPRDIDRVNAFADGLRANSNFDHAQMVFRRQCQQWHEEGVLSTNENVAMATSFRYRGQAQKKETRRCFNCNKEGHLARNCWAPKSKEMQNDRNESQPVISRKPSSSTKVYSNKNEISSYFVCPFGSSDYILDSGSSNHHIVDPRKFDCLDRKEESVTVANGAESQVFGTGDVKLCTPQGIVTLKEAKLTPGFGVNLISVRQLTKLGYTVMFNEDMARVRLKEKVVLMAPAVNGLYVFKESLNVAMMCKSTAEELHAQFGHPGKTKTQELKKMFPELAFETIKDCDTCIMANQQQQTYRSTHNNSYELLEVIHMDLCDSKGRGFDGSHYYLLMTDEKSKYTWTVALKNKTSDIVLKAFTEMKMKIERLHDRKIKKIRTDNGREFLGSFDNYLKQQGIVHQFTSPYNHQQNGNAERAIQTISAKIRSLLIGSCMPEHYWPLAMRTATFLHNLLPHSALNGSTPSKTLFTNGKDYIERGGKLHTFGCLAYRWIHQERRNIQRSSKFAANSERLVFAGYDADDNNLLILLDPRTDRVYRERNVKIVDNVLPFCDRTSGEACKCSVKERTEPLPDNDRAIIVNTRMSVFEEDNVGIDAEEHASGETAIKTIFAQPEIAATDETKTSVIDVIAQEQVTPTNETSDSQLDSETEVRIDESETESVENDVEIPVIDEETVLEGDTRQEGDSAKNDSSESEEEPDDSWAAEKQKERLPRDAYNLRDRSQLKPPSRYTCLIKGPSGDVKEPESHHEAMTSQWRDYWIEAENEELKSLLSNGTYDEVDETPEMKVISAKWVFKVKRNPSGTVDRFKARCVARGFEQREGIDYTETFAATAGATTIRTFLTVSKMQGMNVHQIDIKTAFLNGEVDQEIYVRPPPPFYSQGKVWKLKKALYGLKQAPRCWATKLGEILSCIDFHPTKSEPCVFVRNVGGELCYLLTYVDDILISAVDERTIKKVKEVLSAQLDVHDLGNIKTFLSIDCTEENLSIRLTQKRYVEQLIKEFNLESAAPTDRLPLIDTQIKTEGKKRTDVPYRELVGALNYIANWTRPDISAVVSYLSRAFQEPTSTHWEYAKQVLKYLNTTKEKDLKLGKLDDTSLIAFSDANYAPAADDYRKSQSGGVLRLAGSTVGWFSRKQKTTSKSTTASEYVALSAVADEVLWIQQLLSELNLNIEFPTIIYEDCQPAIAVAKNRKCPAESKHIDVKYHSVKDYQAKGYINVEYINTADQLADDLTKVKRIPRDTEILLGHRQWRPESGGVL